MLYTSPLCVKRLSGCLAVCLAVWLSGCLAGCMSVCLAVWLCYCLVIRLSGCLVVWLAGCVVAWLFVCQAVWLSGCLVLCLSVCLAAWVVARRADSTVLCAVLTRGHRWWWGSNGGCGRCVDAAPPAWVQSEAGQVNLVAGNSHFLL